MKERFILTTVIKELPIVIFFLYLAYLCVLFHNRDHRMLDYTVTFDHWWYFHHRLMEGELAQWNPFSLLGRIAVQWNCIPLSILFSPFLVFSDLDLKIFHNLSIIGTFLSISVLYLVGRLLKYDRFLSFLLILVMITGGYRYWASREMYTNILFFYPPAIVCLLSALQSEGKRITLQWFGFIFLLALAFTSARFENIVYSYTFLFIIFFVLLCQIGNWKKKVKIFLLSIAAITTTLALSAWQLSFLITSTLESSRVSSGAQFQKFFDVLLLKWSLISILYQPVLILLCVNLFLWGMFHYGKTVFPWLRLINSIRTGMILLIGAVQIALMKLIMLIPPALGLDRVRAFVPPNTHPAYTNLDIVFSWSGIVSILLLIYCYMSIKKKITPVKLFSFFATMFAGFYIAEYSWHIWPINENTHFFFMIPLFASFIPFGTVRLMIHKRTWIFAVLVIYHFIGETGFFYIYEVFGVPWLAPRAALAEVPFQIILILEAILFLIEGGSRIISKIFYKTHQLFLFGRSYNIFSLTSVAVKTICVLLTLFTLKMFLMPVGAKEIPGSSRAEKVYLREFPFADTPVDHPPARLNEIAYEAKKNSDSIRESRQYVNPFKRARVEDSVVSTSDNMFYKYLPAYSQTLNTAPLYATELPKTIRTIFIPDYEEKEGKILKKAHPEMNPTFIDYKKAEGKREGTDDIFGNQSTPIMIFPHEKNDLLYREILAEEGSRTPRAFLTKKVIRLRRYVDEYNFLHSVLANGNFLTDQITTSDSRFPKTDQKNNDMPLAYTLEFRKDDPEHIALDVKSTDNSYLALMDAWSKGWRAYVDGKETVIYRGYIGNRFIRIQAGNHIVEFKYTVPGLMGASIISALAWIATFSLLVIYWRKNRKKLKC